MKTLTQPITGLTFKMGRNQPTTPHCRSSFKKMMDANVLPSVTVPENTNYSTKAAASLHNIYKNDVLGDCVIAAGLHLRGVTSGNSSTCLAFTEADVIKDYSAIGGYDPSQTAPDGSNPTDGGCDENTAISYWEKTGFPDGVKLVNAIAVDATKPAQVRLALYLFENLFFGVGLPDAWVNPMPASRGWRWDVAGPSDANNGHAFLGVDLVPNGVKIASWGMCGYLTEAAIAYYASPAQGGQLFTLLSPDIVSRVSEKSPAGYDINVLKEYLTSLK